MEAEEAVVAMVTINKNEPNKLATTNQHMDIVLLQRVAIPKRYIVQLRDLIQHPDW